MQLVKRLLTKVKARGQDLYLAILDWHKITSASIWNIGCTKIVRKTLLPTAGTLLQPKMVSHAFCSLVIKTCCLVIRSHFVRAPLKTLKKNTLITNMDPQNFW